MGLTGEDVFIVVSQAFELGRSKILVVDDSISALALYKGLLENSGVEVHTAKDGEEGLEKAREGSYDLIISDVDMPRMDGIHFCRALRAESKTSQTPILIASTFHTEADIEKGFKAGASAYLSKSEVSQHLIKTISDILFRSRQVQRRKILIVDDSTAILQFLQAGLAGQGFETASAANGKLALDLLAGQRPDLILSDINMPVMDGFALCRTVKENPELAGIPFVVMSTSHDRAHMNRMVQYGAAAYLVKPFNLNQLVVFIEKILSDHFLLLLKERERLTLERDSLLGSISSLISALEARDSYTRGHSEGVAQISSEIVALSGASEMEVERVAIGGRLHDIGKIGVRDSVLLNPGRLSDEEFAHIKQHPEIGRSILQAIPSLADILPIVYHHHEYWNGKGYPLGLKKNEIPFWARVTAVADVFHALTSDRPYRDAMPVEKALDIIRAEREKQFCPECVDLFFQWVSSRGAVARHYPL